MPGSFGLGTSAGPTQSLDVIAGTVEPPQTPAGGDGALSLVVPGLVAGIPIFVVVLIVIAQIAGGAAWLPVIRRWLNRRLIPGPERRSP